MQEEINKSILWRGYVLHEICMLEMLLNSYLSSYFCGSSNKDKIVDMILLILGDERMNLGAKAQVFYGIAPHKHKEWYDSYKSIRKHDKGKKPYSMNADLVWVIEQRNVFAHRVLGADMLPLSKEKEAGSVRFIQFKNGVNPIDYTKESFQELMDTIVNLTTQFKGKINDM